ncbi:MAG TPA: tRNA (adenosine(37)-N6)-dimethylallyltransferase MiaA [Burkholderiaceae bacterium]|jgi:tRNA dimethylallyltransferase|nr:tRNA (adenosine(37)-N6)-dimethylallyltransferase MiaA [Burkholderiaceae bacterium]
MALPARGRAILNDTSNRIGWIGLAGPTAAGKSALALALSRRWPVEIVSVDSALVYRHMDIGTAKPAPKERAEVPHHLLDLIEPEERYSAARFVADARRLVQEIRDRGRWPLLVGGTLMYFKALIDGLDVLPPADPALRAVLDAEAAERGWPALHADLARVDPSTAARLAPHDAQRIQRALEVHRLAGVAMSTLHTRQVRADKEAAPDHVLFALEPEARAWLHARIAVRFDAMLAAGLLDEVRALRRRPNLNVDLPAMRSVGYRQAWEALDAADPPDLAALRERALAATRQLAKRQLTWLRGMPARVPIAADAHDGEARWLAQVERVLGPPGTTPTGSADLPVSAPRVA